MTEKPQDWTKWYDLAVWRGPNGIRVQVLQSKEDCICRRCKREASTEVDHIVPHKGDWDLFTLRSNLQGLCAKCHSEKTAEEDGGFGRESTPETLRTPTIGNVDAMLADVADVTYEEACDLADTGGARAFIYAMLHGQPYSTKDIPSDAELLNLKRCIDKYGRDREGWKGYEL